MHRTQVLIEDWQYEALRARAEQEGLSLSALLRAILDRAFARSAEGQDDRLRSIQGVGEDAASYGEDHDRFLYGDADQD